MIIDTMASPSDDWISWEGSLSPSDTPDRRDPNNTALASNRVDGENNYWRTTLWANGRPVVLDSRPPQPGFENVHQAYEDLAAAVRKAARDIGLPPGSGMVSIRTNPPKHTASNPLITVEHAGATPDQLESLREALAQTVPAHFIAAGQAVRELGPKLNELATAQDQARAVEQARAQKLAEAYERDRAQKLAEVQERALAPQRARAHELAWAKVQATAEAQARTPVLARDGQTVDGPNQRNPREVTSMTPGDDHRLTRARGGAKL